LGRSKRDPQIPRFQVSVIPSLIPRACQRAS